MGSPVVRGPAALLQTTAWQPGAWACGSGGVGIPAVPLAHWANSQGEIGAPYLLRLQISKESVYYKIQCRA